jgi:hypothetical protein
MKALTKAGLATLALCTTATMLARPRAWAADHVDAPITGADKAADIADVYAWHSGDRLVAAISFAGLDIPGSSGSYDDGVLYGIHVDNDGDYVADQTVWARFGQAPSGDWGVRFEGIPGGQPEVIGPVGEVLDAGLGLRAFAGVRDDAFFFDLDGFKATRDSGTLSFDARRDSFASTNVTMVVVEMSIDGVAGGSDTLHVWATTARKD